MSFWFVFLHHPSTSLSMVLTITTCLDVADINMCGFPIDNSTWNQERKTGEVSRKSFTWVPVERFSCQCNVTQSRWKSANKGSPAHQSVNQEDISKGEYGSVGTQTSLHYAVELIQKTIDHFSEQDVIGLISLMLHTSYIHILSVKAKPRLHIPRSRWTCRCIGMDSS